MLCTPRTRMGWIRRLRNCWRKFRICAGTRARSCATRRRPRIWSKAVWNVRCAGLTNGSATGACVLGCWPSCTICMSAGSDDAPATPAVSLTDSMAAATHDNQGSRLDAQRVLAAARGTAEDQRMAVLLVGVEEMSYRDAAEVLGIPLGTLMSRLHRGRELLRRLLGMAEPAPAVRRVK